MDRRGVLIVVQAKSRCFQTDSLFRPMVFGKRFGGTQGSFLHAFIMVGKMRLRVEVTTQQQGRRSPRAAAGKRFYPRDKLLRLQHGRRRSSPLIAECR